MSKLAIWGHCTIYGEYITLFILYIVGIFHHFVSVYYIHIRIQGDMYINA